MSTFLRYIVERALDGTADDVKEYSIGVDVFDRGDAFDPRTDTIVRVHAGRLRKKLAEYYATDGDADPVVIEVPKGGYVPLFRCRSEMDESPSDRYPVERHMVGREREIAALETGLQQVSAGQSLLVGVTGEAGMDLSRLWQQQSRQNEAHQLLSGVYTWFTEGFATRDLKEAKALLDGMDPS